MPYEYTVIPAPRKPEKAKGIRNVEERFARSLESAINTMARNGWDYVRTESIPMEQRSLLGAKTVVHKTLLVFKRESELEMMAGESFAQTYEEPAYEEPVYQEPEPVYEEAPEAPTLGGAER